MKKLFPLLYLIPLLTACPPSPHQAGMTDASSEDRAMVLFAEGLDHFDAAHRSEAFMRLEKEYPESPWNRRAKVIANLAGSIRLLEKKAKRQDAAIAAREEDQQVLTDLRRQNDILAEQVKALKALIVDLELRQP